MKPRRLTLWLTAVCLSLVAGCADGAPEIQPDPEGANPPPVVETVQITRILEAISAELAAPDQEPDADNPAASPDAPEADPDNPEAEPVDLSARLGGAALKIRTAEMALQAAYEDYKVNDLGTGFSDRRIVAQAKDWPRSFVVATEPAEAQARFLCQITQLDPRDDYKLVAFARMLPDAQVPATADPEVGSPVVGEAAEGLAMSPYEALTAYAQAKEDPNGDVAALFDTALAGEDDQDRDPVRQAWTATKAAFAETLPQVEGTLVADSQPDESYAIMALATVDKGAVVFGQVKSTIDITITLPEGAKWSIGKLYAGLGASADVTKSVHLEYLQTVVLGIGPRGANSGPVQVLAVSHAPVDVQVE